MVKNSCNHTCLAAMSGNWPAAENEHHRMGVSRQTTNPRKFSGQHGGPLLKSWL
jgi:hypothetical protein